MQLTMRRPVVPRAFLYLTILALLLVALAVGALLLPGSQPVPGPLGPTNGLIAYDSAGQLYVADPDGSDSRPIDHAGRSLPDADHEGPFRYPAA